MKHVGSSEGRWTYCNTNWKDISIEVVELTNLTDYSGIGFCKKCFKIVQGRILFNIQKESIAKAKLAVDQAWEKKDS